MISMKYGIDRISALQMEIQLERKEYGSIDCRQACRKHA